MYADDHQLYNSGKDLQEVDQIMKSEANIIKTWYKEFFLQANPKKYQTLTIKSKSQVGNKTRTNLNLGGSDIKSSSCLEFNEHISVILGVINRLIFQLMPRCSCINQPFQPFW
jgi:hypothetical protein